MKRVKLICSAALFILFSNCIAAQGEPLIDKLGVSFKGDAKIETGSIYAGIEFHHGLPVPQRISFYYPAANSLDESADYWKRDTSFIMDITAGVDGKTREKLSEGSYSYFLTPFSAEFSREDSVKAINIKWNFTEDKPSAVFTCKITNKSAWQREFSLEAGITKNLRTCHTYALAAPLQIKRMAGMQADCFYYSGQTKNAAMFIINAAEKYFSSDSAGSYFYKKNLKPGEELSVVIILGTCAQEEVESYCETLEKNYKADIEKFEKRTLDVVFGKNAITSGDRALDKSVYWAKAMLEVNRHYIDGDIMPMPCPAEYNFFFTHDVLLTDLAAVYYDLARVKNDLSFIIKHADADKNIPHAYYWKDDRFVTEPADSANWNHLWFIIASAAYVRHSADAQTGNILYPYVSKSLAEVKKSIKDGLVTAYRPDWWDIGNNPGPRAFMTILTIKAMRDYLFLSSFLNRNVDSLPAIEKCAGRLNENFNRLLWDDEMKFPANNLEDGSRDKHYYIGSLLASHYGIVDGKRSADIAETAGKYLLNSELGIYAVYPADFEKLNTLFRFKGDEAGGTGFYLNGGIWPHGNAWYAMSLKAAGRKGEALNFIKKCMTLDGVTNSPGGQPAMYEYRVGMKNSAAPYGMVDKPQFMWAAGWYLYSLYNILLTDENSWNISLSPFGSGAGNISMPVSVNGAVPLVAVKGNGNTAKGIMIDGKEAASVVLPGNGKGFSKVEVITGEPEKPLLLACNSILLGCSYDGDSRVMRIRLKAFKGHGDSLVVFSPVLPDNPGFNYSSESDAQGYRITIPVTFAKDEEVIEIKFKK